MVYTMNIWNKTETARALREILKQQVSGVVREPRILLSFVTLHGKRVHGHACHETAHQACHKFADMHVFDRQNKGRHGKFLCELRW